MIPTIGEANSASAAPQLKISSLSETPKGAVSNNVQEDSKIPRSSFSKESTMSSKKSPKSEPHKVKKVGRKVSFVPETVTAERTYPRNNSGEDSLDGEIKKSDRVVSFNKRVRIRKIRQLEDMTPEQIEATYFTEQELVDIRNGLRTQIRSLVEQNFQEEQHEDCIDDEKIETTFCIRGLEHEFPRGKYRRKQLKMMSRGAVLEEQRLQREFFIHSERSESTHDTASTIGSYSMVHEDPSLAISDVYRIESKPAVQLALEMAKRDEFVADQIYFAHQAI